MLRPAGQQQECAGSSGGACRHDVSMRVKSDRKWAYVPQGKFLHFIWIDPAMSLQNCDTSASTCRFWKCDVRGATTFLPQKHDSSNTRRIWFQRNAHVRREYLAAAQARRPVRVVHGQHLRRVMCGLKQNKTGTRRRNITEPSHQRAKHVTQELPNQTCPGATPQLPAPSNSTTTSWPCAAVTVTVHGSRLSPWRMRHLQRNGEG